MNITILTYDSIDSTNTEALKQARQGADEGLCIVAREQTAGRGRHGRAWVSEKDTGLYFSIVLRPKVKTESIPLITLMAGVAVHDTLQELGINPDIKWVNDVLVGERKISGILAEATETPTGVAVVVGIGVNVRPSASAPGTATSIQENVPVPAFESIQNSLIKFLSYFYNVFNTDSAQIIEEWRRRSTYFAGKDVQVRLENKAIIGTTDGLEMNGALRIRSANGDVTIVQAGDVESLRATGSRQLSTDSR